VNNKSNIVWKITLNLFAYVESQNLVSVVEVGAEVNLVAGSSHAHDLLIAEQSVSNLQSS
jgi:hypothetical protein